NYVDEMEFLSLTRDDSFKICEAAGIVKVLRHLDQLRSPQASRNVASDLAMSTAGSPAESATLATSVPSNVSCDVWPCDVTDAAFSPAQSSESQSMQHHVPQPHPTPLLVFQHQFHPSLLVLQHQSHHSLHVLSCILYDLVILRNA
uniref:Uncharacterized protein n=1 Tax=Amphimedon queenslandica TaxID=400682 RepID=A0A1X7VGV8_AMPQE